jgi:hypothetical protein
MYLDRSNRAKKLKLPHEKRLQEQDILCVKVIAILLPILPFSSEQYLRVLYFTLVNNMFTFHQVGGSLHTTPRSED